MNGREHEIIDYEQQAKKAIQRISNRLDCTKDKFEQKIEQLKQAEEKNVPEEQEKIKEELHHMFAILGVRLSPKDRNHAEYSKFVKQMERDGKVFEEKEAGIHAAKLLERYYKEFPSPEEYMTNLVNRLEKEEDNWKKDSTRLRILKQFIKYGDYLKFQWKDEENGKPVYDGYGGKTSIHRYVKNRLGKEKVTEEEVLNYLDDGIFGFEGEDNIREATKQAGKYGLLHLAHELAMGNFRANTGSKEGLYLFAIVYDMTYGKENGTERDIEIQLFQKYYTMNLHPYAKAEDAETAPQLYDIEMESAYINYQNYAEVIYLYWLCQKDLLPYEKIRKANEMIKKAESTKGGFTVKYWYGKFTEEDHRRYMYEDKIYQLEEEKFFEFVIDHFYREKYLFNEGKKFICSPFQVRYSLLQTAEKWKKLARFEGKEFWAEWKEEDGDEVYQKEYYRLRREDIDFTNLGLSIDEGGESDFDKMMQGCNLLLNYSLQRCGEEKEQDKEPKIDQGALMFRLYRTDLIIAIYKHFIVKKILDKRKGRPVETFEDLVSEFESLVNTQLKDTYFPPFSRMNLFEVTLVLSAYVFMMKN